MIMRDKVKVDEFLELPNESLPSAQWMDDCDNEFGNVWEYLRDSVLDEGNQKFEHLNLPIILCAARSEWDNVIVRV
jgi:hypothetical protein